MDETQSRKPTVMLAATRSYRHLLLPYLTKLSGKLIPHGQIQTVPERPPVRESPNPETWSMIK